MKTSTNKTVVVELTETEAFALKSFVDLAIKELKDVPSAYLSKAEQLVEQLENVGA